MNRKSSIVNRQSQWAVLGLILLAFLVLFPPYDGSFVGDDFVQFRYVWAFLERPFTAITLLNPYAITWYYRPVQNWWFLANYHLFGFNPFPYYAILASLHALVISLVYRTSRQLHLSPLASFCAAALFAIHAHWVDVVGWLSSVAIVLGAIFNLAAVSAYLTYLRKRRLEIGDWRLETGRFSLQSLVSSPHLWLGLTAVFFLLALITHEEAFLLPVMLLVIRRLFAPPRPTIHERLLFVAMFLLTAVYLYTQFTRPNLTLAAEAIGLSGYLSHLNVGEIGRFLRDSLAHFTMAFGLLQATGFTLTLISLVIVNLILTAYFYGGRVTRLGLTWLLLHLGFIYFALWTQKPELFAGRHIYQAGLGLVWALAAGVDWARGEGRRAKSDGRGAKGERGRKKSPLLSRASTTLLLVTAVILYHLPIIHNTQTSWLARAERYRSAEAQVKALLPSVNANTTIFAHRFPITPSFLPATFQVWYGTTINTAVGGGLPQLQQAGRATRDYYLFDYQDETVVNLMPELQEHEETVFLWAEDGRLEQISPHNETTQTPDNAPTLAVAGPADDLRVSVLPPELETADTWNSLIYPVTVPTDSQLQFSLFATAADAAFRVRILGMGSEWETVLETAVPTPNQWTDITIPLRDYGGQSVIIRLESTKDGIWGNPRLTRD
ncbi:MAG: hypothetical protein H6658_02745 [Ardenticatenaceae bacterium]|nr:hypothetical protein [Ardenticatenaceae bacterium]